MNFYFFLALIRLVLAGSQFLTPSPLFLSRLNEDIASANIPSLKSFIKSETEFLWSPYTKVYRNDGFRLAVQEGQTSVVDLFLKEIDIDAASNENEAIRVASANGFVDIVGKLLQRSEVNPGANDNEALIMAAKNGHVEVVRLLISHPGVDPSAAQNQALIWASQQNHPDIVKLLINSGKVDPTALNQHALRRSSSYGNVDLTRFLLSQPSINPRGYSVKLIFLNAAFFGDLKVIKTLTEAGLKVDKATLERSLQHAQVRGNTEIAQYLDAMNGRRKLPSKDLIPLTEECAICLTNDSSFEGFMTNCNHQFHHSCLEKWLEKQESCPICRSNLI